MIVHPSETGLGSNPLMTLTVKSLGGIQREKWQQRIIKLEAVAHIE